MSNSKKTQAVASSALLILSLALAVQAQVPSHDGITRAPSNPPVQVEPAESPPTPPTYSDNDPRETYVLLAVLCFNEASGNELDCKAIGNVRMRYARSHGITLREALLRLHTERRALYPERAALRTYRAQSPREDDNRPWLGDVRSDLHKPLGWSGTDAEWARTARVFERLFFIAQGVEQGSIRDTCQGNPSGWAGPKVDAEHLMAARLRAQNRVIVICHGTANVYYRQLPRTPRGA